MPILKFIYSVVAVVSISLALFLPAYFFLESQKDQKIELHFNAKVEQTSIHFKAINNAFILLANAVYDNVINKPEIVSIVKNANAASAQERDILRKELYTRLLPLYENLQKYNVHQLHFHLKNSVSFLRFHNPEQFGDSLEVVRYSIDKVNRTGRPSIGFEEEITFNGFRNVFPLFLDKRFGGTVEISYSFDAIKAEELKLRSAYNSFIIRKDIIPSQNLTDKSNDYIPTSISSLYVQDRESLNEDVQGDLDKDTIERINQNIVQKAVSALQTEQEFILHTELDNATYIAIFIPIYNVENKQVAYYVSYEKDPTVEIIKKTFKMESLGSLIGAFILSLMFVLYILSQKRAEKALLLLATTDPLTKLANRNKLTIILEKSIHLSHRYKLPLSIIFFDIDHFKQINDTQGHEAGDAVLIAISDLLSHHIRTSDTFARWGGEEFLIVLPETKLQDAKRLADKFKQIVQDYKFLPNVNVTCSFGVAQLHEDDNEASFIKRADNALFAAKRAGRNKVIEAS